MTPMTLTKFRQLTRRDFDDAAVIEEIRAALQALESAADAVAIADAITELTTDANTRTIVERMQCADGVLYGVASRATDYAYRTAPTLREALTRAVSAKKAGQ